MGQACPYRQTAKGDRVRYPTCFALGCDIEIGSTHLFCVEHWKLVPWRIKTRILETYVRGVVVRHQSQQSIVDAVREAILSLKDFTFVGHVASRR